VPPSLNTQLASLVGPSSLRREFEVLLVFVDYDLIDGGEVAASVARKRAGVGFWCT
jgi:hypothetical protein